MKTDIDMPTARHDRLFRRAILVAALLLAAAHRGRCQDYDDYDDDDGEGGGDTADVPLFANIVYDRLMSLTSTFTKEFGSQLKSCIKDSDKDWDQGFNFSSDLKFLVNCFKQNACPLGAYCPLTTLNKITGVCDTHYCRKGSTSEIRCFKKNSCKPNSANQDITIFGALVMVLVCLTYSESSKKKEDG